MMDQSKAKYQSDLRAKIAEYFSTEEIDLLAFDLGIQPDQLSGTARDSKALSLVSRLAREGRLEELVHLLRKKRQKIEWPNVPSPNQQKEDEQTYTLAKEKEALSVLPSGQIKKATIRSSLGLLIILAAWGIFLLGKSSGESTLVEVTRITEAVPVTLEIKATREVTRIVQQEVEVEVTREIPVEVTRLVESPSDVASANSSVNEAATVTPTPSPTATSSPIITEFFDDFTNGISEEFWKIENGRDNFSIVNGQLVTSGNLEISIGDESWTNYVVEVNIVKALTNVTRGNYVGIRRTDTSMVAVAFAGSGESQIYLFENGNWSFVPNSKFINPNGEKTLRLEVEENNLSVFYNGIFVKSILIDNESGKVSLKIGNNTTINWFKITPIQ